jgi:hypothetical protein
MWGIRQRSLRCATPSQSRRSVMQPKTKVLTGLAISLIGVALIVLAIVRGIGEGIQADAAGTTGNAALEMVLASVGLVTLIAGVTMVGYASVLSKKKRS